MGLRKRTNRDAGACIKGKENNGSELYFEEEDIEAFARRLDEYPFPIRYVNRLMEHSWGQKVIRFYDPDGNLIEVGTPVSVGEGSV